MYVKVHNKGNQWFRDDGTLVGEEVSYPVGHQNLVLQRPDGHYIVAIRGYIKENNSFIPLCNNPCPSWVQTHTCSQSNSEFCMRNVTQESEYYIPVSD